MALVPFTYANPYTDQLRVPERLFTVDGRLIKIKQAWKAGGKGGTNIGFGASVYPAAYVLAEYLERHPHLVRGKRVIELGTGTGFLGIAAAALGAAEVCLTDGDNGSLRLAQENITANRQSIESPPNESPTPVYTKRLLWGCADDIEVASHVRTGGESWDVIIGSDIAALPYASAHRDLLDTILSLANITIQSVSENSKCHLSERDGGPERPKKELPLLTVEAGGSTLDARKQQRPVGNKVVVLLAHKRRHVSEDVFFKEASQALPNARILGKEDIHPDFRDAGIRIHTFSVG